MTEEEKAALAFELAQTNYENTVSQETALQEQVAASSAPKQPTPTQAPPQQPVADETPPPVETPPEEGFNPLEAIQGAIQDPIGAIKGVQDTVAGVTNPQTEDTATGTGLDIARMIPTALTQGPSGVIGQAFQDLGMDAIGSLPGLGWVDDQYDKNTRFNNPILQNIREKLSVIIPAGLAGGAATAATGGMAAPTVVKGLTALGLGVAADATISGVSDQSETENNTLRDLDDMFPQLNIPDRFKTLDGDSPEVRTEKHIYDSIGMSLVGEFLGFSLQAGKPLMRWFKPLNRTAENYKAEQLSTMIDGDTSKAIAQIDEIITSGEVDPRQLENLQLRKNQLIQESAETGSSSASRNTLESYAERSDNSRQVQIDEDGINALRENPGNVDYNPSITSSITDPVNNPRLTIEAGNVAKNMVDTTAIKLGFTSGNPPPLLSSPMIKKGIGVDGSTRNMVKALAEESRSVGRFQGIVDGYRFSKRAMNEAAWKIYADIMEAPDTDSLRELFISRREATSILGERIEFINEEAATATGFALRDLVNTYVGREVTEASARAMDTIGREISTQAKAVKEFGPQVANTPEILDQVLDKMNFLMDEYAINKYIAGWTLNNKKFWKGNFGNQASETLTAQREMFDAAVKKKKGMNREFTKEIKRLAKEDPKLASTLVDAYAISDGDVTTLAKLDKYVWDQLNPLSMIKSPKGGMTMFASGMWAVRFNNILSGLSASRAALGAIVNLNLKPLNSIVGLGLESLVTGDASYIKSGIFAYSSFVETNRRALKYMWNNYKQANIDPDSIVDMARKDYVMFNEEKFKVFDDVASTWADDGDWGKKFLYGWTKNNHNISKNKYMRWGTNAMVGIDAYVNSTQATQLARFNAYWDASKKGLNEASMRSAERKIYRDFFNDDGLIKNDAVKNAAGEINMNLDTDLSRSIGGLTDNIPVMKSFFTFPRTGINAINLAMSYTPIAAIPGLTKYGKIMRAGDDIDKITLALAEHGIDYNTTPNAMNIYKNLRAEYTGRIATGAAIVSAGMAYGLAGNVRGPGHHDTATRQKERDNLGYIPFTARIPFTDKWFDYRSLGEPIASLLSLVGSTSYYLDRIDQPIYQDIVDKATWTVTATYTNQTFLSQLEPVIGLFTGDERAVNKFLANEIRSYVPASGFQGVVANAISSANKDIENNALKFVMARLPGLNTMLPDRIDYWTGGALNDIDNPLLRTLNAVSPLKISQGNEPWRVTLQEMGYDGLSLISKDSSGSLEYPEEVRAELYKKMGETQPWKAAKAILDQEGSKKQIADIKAERNAGVTSKQLREKNFPIWRELDQVILKSRQIAEDAIAKENTWISEYINYSKQAKIAENMGNIDSAKQNRMAAEELLKRQNY